MAGTKTVSFKGMFGLYIRTYTDSYTGLRAIWNFDPNMLLPVDFTAYQDADDNLLGMQGNVFDLEAGTTNFQIGNVTSGTTNILTYGKLIPTGTRLQGFTYPVANTETFLFNDYPFPLGTDLKLNSFEVNNVHTITEGGPNTETPLSYCNNNFETFLGVYSSGEIMEVPFYLQADNRGDVYISGDGFNAGFGNTTPLELSLPFNGFNYGLGGPDGFFQTDFIAFASTFALEFGNPPGSFDLNAFVNSLDFDAWTITNQGFLIFNGSTETINGVTLNGFGIFIAPDFSSYQIIQIVPTDAASVNWNSSAGSEPQGKFDTTGHLFIKQFDVYDTIYVSTGVVPVFRNLPVFPPIALPDMPTDTEETLNLYRGVQSP